MALPVKTQLRYWGIAAAVFLLLLWFLGDVLVPFVIGGAIAYFMDPVADRLESWGLSRGAATGVITVGAIAILVIMGLAVLPALIRQAVDLANLLPQLFKDLQGFLVEKFPQVLDDDSQLRQTLNQVGEAAQSRALELVDTALSSALTVINIVVLMVITPGGAGTRHLVSEEVIRALGPDGILVNVARGSVVDEAALVRALEDGGLGGAGLDVFEAEPKIPDALKAMDQVVLAPHVGSASVETRAAMANLTCDNLFRFFEDGSVLTPVPECRHLT